MFSIFSMNSFDILIWSLTAYVLVRMLRSPFDSPDPVGVAQGDTTTSHLERPTPEHFPRGGSRKMSQATLWLLLGLLLGIGLLNKISMLWLGFGIAAGIALTPYRFWLRTRWPWIAGSVAALIFLPYIIWNITHDFAHLEFIRNATGEKYSSQTALTFIVGQILLQNPITLPLWLAGLYFYFSKSGRQFRPLGIIYVAAFTILIVNGHSKAEYLSPAYGVLMAAGAVMFERWFAGSSWRWMKPAYFGLLIISGCFLAPLARPLLPVETYVRYQDALGMAPHTAEAKQLEKLPQFYADRFGWEEKAAAVARVFNALTVEEKATCAIFADNYGRCGAIDFFGAKYGLPKSIGLHNNYWIWGPRQYTGEIVIILGGSPEDHRQSFAEVVVADTVSSAYCMPYENHLTISVCRKLMVPVDEVWAQHKHYE
ncbi:MAG: glycosyltransferase family 39 protein, partial [Bacteroidota bacterium]